MSSEDRGDELLSTGFRDGGLYIMRSKRIYCLAVCHRIGVNRHGPHKHNDWLSFELCVDGRPVIIDPGTYCYTGNSDLKRMFRSTAYHNTVMVDEEEQIRIDQGIFGLKKPVGDASVLSWESNRVRDVLVAEHTGYTRLADPVVHQRRFILDKQSDRLQIRDTLTGHGMHILEWNFHLAKDMQVRIEDGAVEVLHGDIKVIEMSVVGGDVRIEAGDEWVSTKYNHRDEAKVIRARSEMKAGLPSVVDFNFRLCNPCV